MIGLDTNVVVRYLVQDDPVQSPQATRLIEALSAENPGYLSMVSMIELVWVLTKCYGSSREEIYTVLEALLRTKDLVVSEADLMMKAARLYRKGKADFADCLIATDAKVSGCSHTVTFDVKAAETCGMQLIT